MEQKDYSLEVVKVLSAGKNHVRGIAKILGVNHMMVVRKMKILLDRNVVDFEMQGRN